MRATIKYSAEYAMRQSEQNRDGAIAYANRLAGEGKTIVEKHWRAVAIHLQKKGN